MPTTSIPVQPEATITIRVSGDLMLRGREGQEILARAESNALRAECQGLECRVTCVSDCSLLVPFNAKIMVEKVGGDASISSIKSSLHMAKVGGDLNLNDIALCEVQQVGGDVFAFGGHDALSVQHVGGDLDVQSVSGSLTVGTVGGDMLVDGISGSFKLEHCGGDISIREILGDVSCQQVGGDLNLQIGAFPLSARVGGDLKVGITQISDQTITLLAGGDLAFSFPSTNASADLFMTSDSQEIELRLSGERKNIDEENYHITLGEGASKIVLEAGGEIRVTDEPWISPHFDRRFEKLAQRGEEHIVEWNEAWQEFDQRVSRAVEKAAQRAQAAAERAELRVHAAMERVNQRIGNLGIDRSSWQFPMASTAGGGTISNDERMLILKMLQEKKITVEEAEKLLQTLEGLKAS